ncbi:MAG: histidine kinase [Xanthobacteraceae bacterium]
MPSLFRFLTILAIIAGLGYAAMFALVTLVKLRPREITVSVPQHEFLKPPHR